MKEQEEEDERQIHSFPWASHKQNTRVKQEYNNKDNEEKFIADITNKRAGHYIE